MPDYGHELLFGAGLAPNARDHRAIVATIGVAEDLGLEMAGFQDHPYQPAFLDTWTLLSYLAARTQRIRLFPNVANVPLRPPAVLAKSAAALDILSDGRVELGLGAGYFLDAIASIGGPRRSMSEQVDALGEAITVIRNLWKTGPPVDFRGRYYQLEAARPGPEPPHPIRIWLGAYKRRMLELTGRLADGWIPSLGYAAPEELGRMNAQIDEAARAAGRLPTDIVRGFNINGSFSGQRGFLQDSPRQWAEQLAGLTLENGISTFILGTEPRALDDLRRFAAEVVPAVRELVANERGGHARPAAAELPRLMAEHEKGVSAVGRAGQETLLAIHEHLRQELARLRAVIQEVAEGRRSAADARSYLAKMTMRQNYWTLGAFCAAYCRVVSVHHAIEDQVMFPDLKAADQALRPIIERLKQEHEGIAELLAEIDAALTAMVADEDRLVELAQRVNQLGDALLAHLKYEEDSLLDPIGRLSIRI